MGILLSFHQKNSPAEAQRKGVERMSIAVQPQEQKTVAAERIFVATQWQLMW